MLRVDAPWRISTPGQATSGAAGVGDAGWVTPGLALENRLVKRLPNEDVSSPDPPPVREEQPETAAAANSSIAAARQRPHFPFPSCPGRIENTRLFPTIPPPCQALYQPNRGDPKAGPTL